MNKQTIDSGLITESKVNAWIVSTKITRVCVRIAPYRRPALTEHCDPRPNPKPIERPPIQPNFQPMLFRSGVV